MKADGIGKSPYSLSVSGENELKDDVARRVLARDVLQVSGENELKARNAACGETLFIFMYQARMS